MKSLQVGTWDPEDQVSSGPLVASRQIQPPWLAPWLLFSEDPRGGSAGQWLTSWTGAAPESEAEAGFSQVPVCDLGSGQLVPVSAWLAQSIHIYLSISISIISISLIYIYI